MAAEKGSIQVGCPRGQQVSSPSVQLRALVLERSKGGACGSQSCYPGATKKQVRGFVSLHILETVAQLTKD